MPRNVADFKDHPIYALERHLRRHEVLKADAQPAGTVSAGSRAPLETIYRRRDVRIARSRDKWYRMGRDVKAMEMPVKFLTRRINTKPGEYVDDGYGGDVRDAEGTPVFTEEQTEEYRPPPVVRGRVPRNKFGNIDLYVPSMVPKGGVWIADDSEDGPSSARAAFILGIDYAPALAGFLFKGRQGTAVLNGVVVAEEYEEAMRAVKAGLSDVEAQQQQDRRATAALRMWKRFLMVLFIRDADPSSCAPPDDNFSAGAEGLDLSDAGFGFVIGPGDKWNEGVAAQVLGPAFLGAAGGSGNNGGGSDQALDVLRQILERNTTVVDSFQEFTDAIDERRADIKPAGLWLGDDSNAPTLAYLGNRGGLINSLLGQNILDMLLSNVTVSTRYAPLEISWADQNTQSLQLFVYIALALCLYPAFFALEPRARRDDEDDAEYRLAIEASKYQEEEDRKRRNQGQVDVDDDDLAKAIKLSQEEEERRRRELEQSNAISLFDDTPTQSTQQSQPAQPQFTGFNQGYQQGSAVDFFANPIDQNAQQPQPTGYLGNQYTGFPQQQQQTGFQNGYGGYGMQPQMTSLDPFGQQQQQQPTGMPAFQPQPTGFNPYQQQTQSPVAQDPFPQAGSNNPWATNNNQQSQSPLRAMQTGSNNPFAPSATGGSSAFGRPQTQKIPSQTCLLMARPPSSPTSTATRWPTRAPSRLLSPVRPRRAGARSCPCTS
ncbi:hypothetical protein BN1723_016940 [Verticillium longisporum]|uniref:Uncharacterized protein n=1 Tax=Verticillium longisporum TaxID=100787 RepID=A0A0G4NQJ8_VERLO|nr:hypothetical protein BN1723_016940 [Verticillium longisporum]